MRIVKDCDGDIWEEIPPVPSEPMFRCLTQGSAFERTLDEIQQTYGPVEVFEPRDSR